LPKENEPKERALFRRCFLKAFSKPFKNRPSKAKFSPRLQKFFTLSWPTLTKKWGRFLYGNAIP
jgi:hypothetical protein